MNKKPDYIIKIWYFWFLKSRLFQPSYCQKTLQRYRTCSQQLGPVKGVKPKAREVISTPLLLPLVLTGQLSVNEQIFKQLLRDHSVCNCVYRWTQRSNCKTVVCALLWWLYHLSITLHLDRNFLCVGKYHRQINLTKTAHRLNKEMNCYKILQ